MKEKKLIIYGIGKFADYTAFLFNNDSKYQVHAYCLESTYLEKVDLTTVNLPIVSLDEVEKTYKKEEYDVFIAVGNDKIRARIFKIFQEKNYNLASYISSQAIVFNDLKIGRNVLITEDCGIQPFVKIDDNSLIIASKLGHHCTVGKNCLLSLTIMGANSKIGNNSFLGLNSTVMPNIEIGDKNIIGMGCAISRNTKDGEVYTNSTTIKRKVTYDDIGDRYL